MRGSGFLLFSLASLFLLGAICQGVLVSIVTRNQLLSSQISIILSYLPTFILSGFIYPIHNMPQFIQFITYVVPGRYVVTILKGIYSKGIGLEILWVEALLLAVYAGGMTLWTHKRFQKTDRLTMWQRLKSMLIKEFIQALRNPRMRIILFLPPLVQLLIFGYASAFQVLR